MVVACLSRTARCAAYGQSIFYLGEFCRRASRHLQSTHEAGLDVVDQCRSQTPRTGTVMTAQIEAVDFFAFDNSYARLPDRFFALLPPTPVAAPRLVRLNKKLAWHEVDPRKLAAPEGVEICGNRVPERRAARHGLCLQTVGHRIRRDPNSRLLRLFTNDLCLWVVL